VNRESKVSEREAKRVISNWEKGRMENGEEHNGGSTGGSDGKEHHGGNCNQDGRKSRQELILSMQKKAVSLTGTKERRWEKREVGLSACVRCASLSLLSTSPHECFIPSSLDRRFFSLLPPT
jgi:hypothetical protein